MTDKLELLCWVQGSEIDRVFPVRVSLSAKVMHLRDEIYQKKPSFYRIDPDALELWKVGKLYWHALLRKFDPPGRSVYPWQESKTILAIISNLKMVDG